MNVTRTKQMILIEIAIVFALVSIVIVLSVIKFFSNDSEEEEEFALINYKVVDVVKEDGKVRLIAEINNHHFLMVRSFDNVIFKHYHSCQKCKRSWKPFNFSIFDGLTIELKNKMKELETEGK